MEGFVSGVRVIRAADGAADPLSVFATLFDEASAISTFTHRLPAGTVLSAHRHTGALSARIDSGAMAFVFGAPPDERVDLLPGDFVWLPPDLVHEELVTSDEDVDLLVAHVGPFETEPA